ncbi:hypothetical protein Tsubulata_045883 [Turnera subulata]|uniref:F-box domain-containing protein n=1 Tax=Turnera subulata TaxID=218843 RepID=A0A9Q0J030_9ROSI|nr:hypothetical protein Tsubulata_045883 [Turnera subulata]
MSSSEKQENTSSMEMKHNKTRAHDNNRLLVDQAKSTNTDQLVMPTNMAAAAAPNRSCLPPDILEEILDLLPKKSIERFRSVSKSLFSLLTIKFTLPKLLHYPCITNFPPSCGVKSSDDKDLFTGVVFSEYSGGGDVKNQGYKEPDELLFAAPDQRPFSFVGSCNGLVCLDVLSNHCYKWETFVWNPFTGICRQLPQRCYHANGFGYDSASNDYKVFAAAGPLDPRPGDDSKVEIFSLKTGSRKKLENPDREYLQHILGHGGMGLFLNGALHWRRREESSREGEKGEIMAAIAFDLEKEKFYLVPGPPIQISPDYESSSFGVVGEYLCFSHSEYGYKDTIWVMKEYCNEASWVPFITYSTLRFTFPHQHCKDREGRVEYVCDFIPGSFKDGRFMMLQFWYDIHVINWNNNLEESDEAGKYSKKIKFGLLPTDLVPPSPDQSEDEADGISKLSSPKTVSELTKNRSNLLQQIGSILDLLPNKSIERFRSVSKSLSSLLAIKFNLPKLILRSSKFGMKSSDDDRGLFTGVVLPVHGGGDVKIERGCFFVGSCDGLVCLGVGNYRGKVETLVWNPLTDMCRKFPKTKYYAYGFGYDSASNDYKVFAATGHLDPRPGDRKVEIFSLKIGSWEKLENPDRVYLQLWGMGLFLNGALHWRPARESTWGKTGEIIAAIAFDLEKEKFYLVPGPPIQISSPGYGYGSYYSFGVVGEYLCFCRRNGCKNIVWVMKEYCNQASWVPFITYTIPEFEVRGEGRVEYVCDFIPQSFKDDRYMLLHFLYDIHVIYWNNNLEESAEAGKYSKKIKFGRAQGNAFLPYTQTLTSPYIS